MANRFVITSDTLTPGLKAFPKQLDRAIGTTVDYFAGRTQDHARSNAPWTDQTANARNTLTGTAEHELGRRHAIVLAHGMPYGIWLEVRNSGKFAIIIPTIKTMGAELMGVLRTVMARMR